MQQIPSSSLYDLWMNMGGISPFHPIKLLGERQTTASLPNNWSLKSDAYTWQHTKTAHGLSSIRWNTRWDGCQHGCLAWNLPPNNGLNVTGKHFLGDSEAKVRWSLLCVQTKRNVTSCQNTTKVQKTQHFRIHSNASHYTSLYTTQNFIKRNISHHRISQNNKLQHCTCRRAEVLILFILLCLCSGIVLYDF